jgi:UDP-N-acetylglucosamine diphosphorylase/glucosamine-1-phosphate N-acetyltransferase
VRLCVYEDNRVASLEPLALTRPAFDLLCGSCSLLERQRRAFGARDVGAVVRPDLAALCGLEHPEVAVNAAGWLRRPDTVLVNARWLPPPGAVPDLGEARVGMVGDEVAYVVLPPEVAPPCAPAGVEAWVEGVRDTLPRATAGGSLIAYPWDLVEHNPRALREDLGWRRREMGDPEPPDHLAVVGPREAVLVHPEAALDPYVVADARGGPVVIDRGARVQSFSRLEGPCYVGPDAWVLGARLRGGTVGPQCRVGGEVEASILHGHCNKYHDGFLGHSYLGEWVNLAAGTQVSDLRNDYGEVTVTVAGTHVPTGLPKVGAFLGDHTKTGLNTLLNTGTVAGAFCGLLPTGTYLPRVVPSFCTCAHGQLQERWELWQLFETAATAMRRRGRELTAAHTDLYFTLYDQTAPLRRRLIREAEQKRLRRSLSGS